MISVALCTYNGSRFLCEQLDSIAAQTRLPDELVICDDGSTDSTVEIVETFMGAAPFPVRFVQNSENLGSTRNFEKAIRLCTGDLIALSDQDDLWLPHRLARQSELMERDATIGGVFSDAELVDENSAPLGYRLWHRLGFTKREQRRFRGDRGRRVMLKRTNVATGATFMLRADLRPTFLPIPPLWVHDNWIAWMLLLYSGFVFMPECLIRYRIHPQQQIGIKAQTYLRHLSLWDRLRKARDQGPMDILERAQRLVELRQRLSEQRNASVEATLPCLNDKVAFLFDRVNPLSGRWNSIQRTVLNCGKYYRYENNWKSWLRDLAIAFIP